MRYFKIAQNVKSHIDRISTHFNVIFWFTWFEQEKQFRLPSLLVLCRRYICSTTTVQKTKRGQVFVWSEFAHSNSYSTLTTKITFRCISYVLKHVSSTYFPLLSKLSYPNEQNEIEITRNYIYIHRIEAICLL